MLQKEKQTIEPDFAVDYFVPRAYYKTYYSSVMQDEEALIHWQSKQLDKLLRQHLLLRGKKDFSLLFDAGSGPVVHHMLALCKYTKKIHLADYMPENIAEIQKWVNGDIDAHNWTVFTRTILESEGTVPTSLELRRREQMLRRKIETLSLLDLKKRTRFTWIESAPMVTSFFVADSATRSKNVFRRMTKNAFEIVQPGGVFIATYLGGCDRYRVGNKWISSAHITEQDIREVFAYVHAKKLSVWKFNTPKMSIDGFDHVFAVVAEK